MKWLLTKESFWGEKKNEGEKNNNNNINKRNMTNLSLASLGEKKEEDAKQSQHEQKEIKGQQEIIKTISPIKWKVNPRPN